ncbi:MAG: flagellar biosynthetic protein FliO [Verrucomicrobiae bacterium]|nr:flagellar biosynthetic protein FliO [Verrucomicrobiae bacterium]MDW8343291.1 flagellar biosynthetic protein FliO [Verrucomicrobiae bacterium]
MIANWIILAETTPPPLPDTATVWLRVVGALVVVFALIWAGSRWLRANTPGGSRARCRLQVLECRALGHRQMLWVVGYDRQRWLVASSPAGVSLVASLPPAEPGDTQTPAGAGGFAETLQRVLMRSS